MYHTSDFVNVMRLYSTIRTNSMELNSSYEATSCLVTHEFPKMLWNPRGHYRIHKSLPLVPITSQITLVHITPSYFSKTHFNIIPHLHLCLPNSLFPSGFATKILYVFLSPMCATYPAYLILLDLIILSIFGECWSWTGTSCDGW
jgi:hypothetical protein